MQIKRFFAADMRQAMKRVRDELGPDAAIIGNRRVAGGVELTAALDYQAPQRSAERGTGKPNAELESELRKTQARIAQAEAQLSGRLEAARSLQAKPEPEPVVAAPKVQAPTLESMRMELHGLRELIEVQLGSFAWNRLCNQQPTQAELWRRLQRIGLPPELVQTLLERVSQVSDTRQAWRLVLAHLAQGIRVPQQEVIEDGGVVALVGPGGMGKSTTLAKLAARYVLRHGSRGLALISLDNYRLGGQEQLKSLGRILDVPVILADPGEPLEELLAPLEGKRLVLIDTPGLSMSDPTQARLMESLADRQLGIRNYLVLSTTSQRQVLKAACHAYRRCVLQGCMLTKLDEAASLGEALGLVIGQSLPVAYVTDGPSIPDDIALVRAHQLVSRAVSLQADEEPREDEMVGAIAGLYQGGQAG